jgi:N utilization substance protein A
MKNEFVLAFNEVLEEKQLPKEVILDALESAMVSAYRRAVNASNAQHVEAKIDAETGRVVIYAEKEIVEAVEDARTEVSLIDANRVDKEAKLGGMIVVETTPRNFGRVAAQTARQVIQQRIREAERDAQMKYFGKQMGEIVSGVVQAVNSQAVTLGIDMKAEGIMPRNQQIPGERFRVHDRVRALLLEVKSSSRGPQIILSRAHRNFLRRLLENEVPEIYQGFVEIRSISREPGQRSKVAVAALQPGVDPVGACVGVRGVRIQAIVRELNDEKIDVIEWNTDPAAYIAKALSPARVNGVYLSDQARGAKTATVVVPEDQLSLAIGRDGQNARLAAKLTSWRIDIKSLPEAASDSLNKLRNDPEYAVLAEQEMDLLPQVEQALAKKMEGRPVTPEEYQVLAQFVDRVERGLLRQRQKDKQAEEERERVLQANIPEAAYAMLVEDLGIPLRYSSLLSGAGFNTVGDLMLQLHLDANAILGLEGIGPKAMTEIEAALDKTGFKAVETAATPAPAEAVAEAIAEPQGEAQSVGEPVAVEAVAEAAVEAAAVPAATGETAEPAEAALEAAEPVEAVVGEPVAEGVVEAASEGQPAGEEEAVTDLNQLFTISPEVLEVTETDEDDESDDDKKKKKKKKKYVEVEFDPDHNVTIVRKKRKRGEPGWEDTWSL